MDVNLLIDAIVRQTTILLAQLATAAGARATLAHTANRVFVDLVNELKDQGLGNKVIADMFGLSLRTYHKKVARLAESSTERGRSLWEAVFGRIQERGSISRADLLSQFPADDDAQLRGVLKDLVDSGLVFRAGRGDATVYRAASAEELSLADPNHTTERLAAMLWVAVNRYAPATEEDLAEHVPADRARLKEALAMLVADGRIQHDESNRFVCNECVIPHGDVAGWEAAVFDHYQAVVTAVCTKLRIGNRRSIRGEWVGGSTYGFDVWEGHPHREEVLGFLQATRERAVSLRKKTEDYNAHHPADGEAIRVIAYVGQTVIGSESEED